MDGDIDIIKSLYLEHIFKGIDYDRLTSDLDKLLWYFELLTLVPDPPASIAP